MTRIRSPINEYLKIPDYMEPSYLGLLEELQRKSRELQPWRPDEFNQRSAAIHEASHCVVAAREGCALAGARIFEGSDGTWLGDFEIDRPDEICIDLASPELLADLRLVLAGRRGELLFLGDKFCLRAGLDELTYALLLIMPAVSTHAQGNEALMDELYGPVWGTTLAEVDETLLAHRVVVDAIADRLIRKGRLQSRKLSQLVAPVTPRTSLPGIRQLHELHVAYDPLAGSSAPDPEP
jgi:hypothetical protein